MRNIMIRVKAPLAIMLSLIMTFSLCPAVFLAAENALQALVEPGIVRDNVYIDPTFTQNVVIEIGSSKAWVDGELISLSEPVFHFDYSEMISVRDINRLFGFNSEYIEDEQVLLLYKYNLTVQFNIESYG